MIRLLPPVAKEHMGRKCLVLDLDETLVHSSFKVSPVFFLFLLLLMMMMMMMMYE